MNKRQLYENIMRNVSREVKKALNENYVYESVDLRQYSDNEIFERYNIRIFAMNEDFNINLDKYKHGVANAIKKLAQKIGDAAGNLIKNIINIAKKTNPKTFILVLSMLCVFGGQASAEITQDEAQNFVQNCQRMYDCTDLNINDVNNYRDLSLEKMNNDSNYIYFTGYGEGLTWEEAKSNAEKAALQQQDVYYNKYVKSADPENLFEAQPSRFSVQCVKKDKTPCAIVVIRTRIK